LRDTKGIQWLAVLVSRPRESLHVLELVAPGRRVPDSDAGELLDSQAIASYKKRLSEVTAELDRVEELADLGQLERIRAEQEFLRTELSRAVGLGQRARRASSTAERARINVQRRLRDAVRRVTSLDAELGQHFGRAVSTGCYCSYRPE
jgi:hypothetical protein